MKIESNERGSKEYYDEFLYVLNNVGKIRKNPRVKVNCLTRTAWIYIAVLVVIGILFLAFTLTSQNQSSKYLIYLEISGLLVLISVMYLIMILKKIKEYMSDNSTTIFEINEKEVSVEKNSNKVILNWENILYVVFNHYSISFIPKNNYNILVGTDIKDKDEVLKAIKKYKKDSLIIDNTDLYK